MINNILQKIKYYRAKKLINDKFPAYHLNIINFINNRYSLRNKMILDAGGSNIPHRVMKIYNARSFICIDPVSKWYKSHNLHYNSDKYCGKNIVTLNEFISNPKFKDLPVVIDESLENIFNQLDNYFDIIISISTMEHVQNISKVYSTCHKMLRPGGILFVQFEPVYSSSAGHHVWIDSEINFNKMNNLRYFHLKYSEKEAQNLINEIYKDLSVEIRKKIIYQAYTSDIINRYHHDQFVTEISKSAFNKYEIDNFLIDDISSEENEILTGKFGKKRYDIRGLRIIAYKDNI